MSIHFIDYLQMGGWIYLSESRIVHQVWSTLLLLINCSLNKKSNYWKRLPDSKQIINLQLKIIQDKRWVGRIEFAFEPGPKPVAFINTIHIHFNSNAFVHFVLPLSLPPSSPAHRYTGLLKKTIVAPAIVAVPPVRSIWKSWTSIKIKLCICIGH